MSMGLKILYKTSNRIRRNVGKSSMVEAKQKVDELHEFVKGRNIVHTSIEYLVMGIKSTLTAAEREHKALRV